MISAHHEAIRGTPAMAETLVWISALCGIVIGALAVAIIIYIVLFVYGLYDLGRSKRD
jgi:uncharacterized protein (DUF2062 family)